MPEAEPTQGPPLLIDVREVARLLGISVRSVWRMTSRGDLPPPVRLGRSVRWKRASIIEEATGLLTPVHKRRMRDG